MLHEGPDDSIHGELVYLERFVDRRPNWAPVVLGRLGELGQEGHADLPRLLAERTVKAKHVAARRRAQLATRAAAVAVLVAGAPALIGTPAAAANLPVVGASHKSDLLEVRIVDSQSGKPLSGVTLLTAGEELVGVTDANGAAMVSAKYAQEPVISLEREGYPMVLVEGSKLSSRSMISMRHFSAGIEQARTTGPMAALAALARSPQHAAPKPPGYAGEPPVAATVRTAPPVEPLAPFATAPKDMDPVQPFATAAAPKEPAAPFATAPKALEPVAPFAAAPKALPAGEPSAPFTKAPLADQPAAPFAKAPAVSAPAAPFAKAPAPREPIAPFSTAPTSQEPPTPFKAGATRPTTGTMAADAQAALEAAAREAEDDHSVLAKDLPEDQTVERPASVARNAGLPLAARPAGNPVFDTAKSVSVKLPPRSPRASQRIRDAELASAPPAAATVAIAPENLPMPATASLPIPAAAPQEPAPGWAVVSLPTRPRQVPVAQAPAKPAGVMAKVTLPPRPRAPQMASAPHAGANFSRPAVASYHVRSGDTLSDIAQRELGSSTLWHVVYDANRDQLTDPRWLEVGLTLKIPRGNDAGGQVYVVKQGDSLSKIARVMLGDVKKWRGLYAANKQQIRDPWFIFPGQRLVLPGTQNLAHRDDRWATVRATVYPPA
ncbi:MAG: hypothetical protein JWM80_3358 [Cyanobacteria bacterium RYN_339]|nr:hypothetical protein [Cyanobacteria bacterium RYN_339]